MVPVADALIVALDASEPEALALASALAGTARWLKVGMTLFYEAGPRVVTELRTQGFDVFLDLKLHDIPHQVEGAARAVARLGVQMLTVHAGGGAPMIAAAVRGAAAGAAKAGVVPPAVLAVTVLTSMDAPTLASVGVGDTAASQVARLAKLAMEAGAQGIVCSPEETALVRAAIGPDALIVTPGVRPGWAEAGDQSRIATPGRALAAGASHLVVGRPITQASDPRNATLKILIEMEAGS